MEIDAEEIRNYVDAGSFIRGRQYYLDKKVIEIETDGDYISGLVQGSEKEPYEIECQIKNGQIIDSDCSCPVGFACKHVVALLLQVAVLQTKKADIEPTWEKTLSKLIDTNQPAKKTIFQLQIILKVDKGYDAYAYLGRYSKKKASGKTKPNLKLTLRPRLLNPGTGSVSLSEISWTDTYYGRNNYYRDGEQGSLSAKQFLYFQMLSQAVKNTWGGSNGWLEIPDEKASIIWDIFNQHEQYQVQLLGGNKGQFEIVIHPQPVSITLEIVEKDQNLQIEKKVLLDDADISNIQYDIVGIPPVFAFVPDNSAYHLYPVVGANTTAGLSEIEKPLIIPRAEVQALQQLLPKLNKLYDLKILTDKVYLPEKIVPVPGINISYQKKSNKIEVELIFFCNGVSFPMSQVPEQCQIGGKNFLIDQETAAKLQDELKNNLHRKMESVFTGYQIISSDRFYLDGLEAAQFIAEILPQVKELMPDLIINIDPNMPEFKLDLTQAEVSLSLEDDKSSNDWFDLQISVKVGSEQVLFSQLFEALVGNQPMLLLESGRYFSLENAQFDKLRTLIAEAKSIRESRGENIQISRFQAGLWEELQTLGIIEKQSQSWQESVGQLLNISKIKPKNAPASLKASLRPYQKEGFSWLYFLCSQKLGGILADDMGLGKTIQTIALICAMKKQTKKPFLVIAPTSVVENWELEIDKFAPHVKKVIFRAGNRTENYKKIAKADVVVTSYPLLVRDFEKLGKIEFETVFLDEAQMVKNYQSKAYSLVRKLNAHSKIALTGTPMENNLMELWSIFSIVCPGLFPEPKKFTEIYRTPIEKHQNMEALKRLRSRIRPFLMRRQKALVETQLPQKSEQVTLLELNAKHKHIYDLQLQHERKRVLGLISDGGLKEHRFEILRSLMKMRQVCLDPVLVDKKHKNIPSTKIEVLKEQLVEIIEENHKVLIFSQFTSFLTIVKKMVSQISPNYLYLDGATKNRGELIKKFQNDESIQVFLISLKSGGFGLNLTAADYCILLDPWWNPAVERQAIDRTHRIGQTRPVFVYKFIAKDTIEEKVLELQQKKQKLFDTVLEEDNMFGSVVTDEDIKRIFEI